MPNPYVTRRTFAFLKELAAHNDREWFQTHKERYEREVRDPLLQLVTDFAPRLRKISKNYVADPRPNGGSLFRIYRDTRFSKDKSPYKNHAAMSFRHADGKDLPAPGFYLHLEPGRVFVGCGLWHAPPEAVRGIREAIVAHPARWKKVVTKRGLTLDEDPQALKRPPRGFDPDHPFIDDLRRKSFTASTRLTQTDALASDFLARLERACKRSTPLMEFLCAALGRPW